MSLDRLPPEIIWSILTTTLRDSSWAEGLRLRAVNRAFNHQVHALYFDRMAVDIRRRGVQRVTVKMGPYHLLRYLRGHILAPHGLCRLKPNILAASAMLSALPDFQWTKTIPIRHIPTFAGGDIQLQEGDRDARILDLVIVSALAFLNVLKFKDVDWIMHSDSQLQPISWALVTAVLLDDRRTLAHLLATVTSVADQCKLFADPLYVAARARDTGLVRLLLEYGADLSHPPTYYNGSQDPRFEMPVKGACEAGDVEMLQVMFDPRYDGGFHRECCRVTGYDDLLTTAVTGLRPSDDEHDDRRHAYARVIQILFANAIPEQLRDLQHQVVTFAIQHDNPQAVALVLEAGYDVNERRPGQQSQLYCAAQHGAGPMVQLLLAHGARQSLERGCDAVHAACRHGCTDALRVLLAHAITLDDYGHALAAGHLLAAARSPVQRVRWQAVLRCLCEFGLDLRAANCGVRLLQIADQQGLVELKAFLLDRGVSLE